MDRAATPPITRCRRKSRTWLRSSTRGRGRCSCWATRSVGWCRWRRCSSPSASPSWPWTQPPVRNSDNAAILARMERLIAGGNRQEALETFYREIVMISPAQIAGDEKPAVVAWLAGKRRNIHPPGSGARGLPFRPILMAGLDIPTLLLSGSDTVSPQLKPGDRQPAAIAAEHGSGRVPGSTTQCDGHDPAAIR